MLSDLNNSLLTSTKCYFDVKLFYETASTKRLFEIKIISLKLLQKGGRCPVKLLGGNQAQQ